MLILEAFLYGVISIFLLMLGYYLLDFIIPCDFYKEIFEEKNEAVGVLLGGLFVAMGLIIRSAVIGGEAHPVESLGDGIFFTLVYSGVGLVLFLSSYMLLALLLRRYDLNKHIDEHNTAAGMALAGFFVAIALVVSGVIQ